MSKINYLNMMLSGYFKNPDLLKIYLIRQQQLAERDNFLSLVEFYDNCNLTIQNVKQNILSIYNERKKELYLILSDRKTKNIDTSDIQKEIDFLKPDNFKIPLLLITNQQFTGHLSYSEIEFIENIVQQIFIYVDEKKDYTLKCNEGNFFYSGSENKLYTGRDFFVKIYLSKGNLKFPINFPDLIPKYYDLALSEYLTSEKNKAKSFFNKKLITIEFIKSEIEKIQVLQNGIEDFINKNKNGTFNQKKEQLKYCKRYSAYLVEKLKDFDKTEINKPQQTDIKKAKKTKNLNHFILNINKKQVFIEDLKKMFPTEIGKPIKAIIRILEKNEILLIPDRQFKSFYESLKLEFNRDIGTYQSINDEKDKDFDDVYLSKFKKKLNPLIIKYKTN